MLSLPDGLLVQCPQVGSGETFIKEMILDRAANELGVKDRHQSDVEVGSLSANRSRAALPSRGAAALGNIGWAPPNSLGGFLIYF
jgi:hypothetical protein